MKRSRAGGVGATAARGVRDYVDIGWRGTRRDTRTAGRTGARVSGDCRGQPWCRRDVKR